MTSCEYGGRGATLRHLHRCPVDAHDLQGRPHVLQQVHHHVVDEQQDMPDGSQEAHEESLVHVRIVEKMIRGDLSIKTRLHCDFSEEKGRQITTV